jgi:hypothetical protein
VNATPLSFQLDPLSMPGLILTPASLHISIVVDNNGILVGGVAGDDLLVQGSVDLNGDYVPDVSGTLLTGEIVGFGALDAGTIDKYDFQFVLTGGLLASYYAGQDLYIAMTSENSTFTDDFQVDFGGGAKGSVGGFGVQAQGEIDIEKYVKVQEICQGGEGLTPGYWKQSQHFDDWVGYRPSDSYEQAFGVDLGSDKTLLQALGTGGGGVSALLRHSTAALLNAANSNISYAYTTQQIISMVQGAFANGNYEQVKNLFAAQNELEANLESCNPNPPSCPDDGTLGEDADDAPGLEVSVGDTVVVTYVVANPGSFALAGVTVVDDNATPGDESDDFSPAPVLAGGHNVGDVNGDDLLQPGEQWLYRHTEVATAGLHTDVASVVATPVDDQSQPVAPEVTDSDPANYYAETAQPLGSIGDYVWKDCNNNGVQDAGEYGVAGVIVTLLNGAGETLATTTTDSGGHYLFDALAAGDYRVQFNAPSGLAFTSRDAGSNDSRDSDANSTTGVTDVLSLAAGQSILTIDAGLVSAPQGGCGDHKPGCGDGQNGSDRDGHDKNDKGRNGNSQNGCATSSQGKKKG